MKIKDEYYDLNDLNGKQINIEEWDGRISRVRIEVLESNDVILEYPDGEKQLVTPEYFANIARKIFWSNKKRKKNMGNKSESIEFEILYPYRGWVDVDTILAWASDFINDDILQELSDKYSEDDNKLYEEFEKKQILLSSIDLDYAIQLLQDYGIITLGRKVRYT